MERSISDSSKSMAHPTYLEEDLEVMFGRHIVRVHLNGTFLCLKGEI